METDPSEQESQFDEQPSEEGADEPAFEDEGEAGEEESAGLDETPTGP
jgi:hypothetical protein